MIATNEISLRQVAPSQSITNNHASAATVDTAILVHMIKSRNEKGFHILYDNYSGALFSIIIKLVRRTDVAEDVLQEVFLKIWKHIDGYDPARGTLFTWMLNIARYNAIDYLRSLAYQQQSQQISIDQSAFQIDSIGAADSLTDEVEFKDLKSKTQLFDPKYTEVIDLIFFHGWTYKQTAEILNLPLGTVKTRARKGLSMLKMIYQQ